MEPSDLPVVVGVGVHFKTVISSLIVAAAVAAVANIERERQDVLHDDKTINKNSFSSHVPRVKAQILHQSVNQLSTTTIRPAHFATNESIFE